MDLNFRWLAASVLALATYSTGFSAVLYDGSLGTSPAAQGYFSYGAAPLGKYYTQNPTSVELNSTSNVSVQSGFQNYNPQLTGLQNSSFPTLDSSAGYTVSIDMQTISENHGDVDDRAGFNLIAVSSNDMGIALGFWPGTIFAQNADFSYGESASFDTTAAITRYNLSVSGSSYTLSTGSTTLLNGSLRAYSDSSDPSFVVLPNFVFFGDDTGAASGDDIVSRLAVTVPEPGAISLLVAGSVLGLSRRRRACS